MRRPGIGLGFELGVSFNGITGVDSSSFSFNTSFGDINSGLFGDSSSTSGSSTSTSSGTSAENLFNQGRTSESTEFGKTLTEQLKVDEAGILRLIDKALKGTSGIAEIFGNEQSAGLFGSSAAKNNTSELLAMIAGEIATLTGVKTTAEGGATSSSGLTRETGTKTGTTTADQSTTSSQSSESGGILDVIGLG